MSYRYGAVPRVPGQPLRERELTHHFVCSMPVCSRLSSGLAPDGDRVKSILHSPHRSTLMSVPQRTRCGSPLARDHGWPAVMGAGRVAWEIVKQSLRLK